MSRYETGDLPVPTTVELAMEALERRMEDLNTAVYEGEKISDHFPGAIGGEIKEG